MEKEKNKKDIIEKEPKKKDKKEEKKKIKKEKDFDTEDKPKSNIKKLIILLIIIGIVLLLWARFVSTSGLVIKEYPIKTVNLSADYDGLKIIQFSDLHYGSTIHENELKKLVKKINQEKPDVILFTGDLVEAGVELTESDINTIKKQLKKLEANIEILAVKGNHDYESDYFDEIIRDLNWNLLDNKYEFVYYNSKSPIIFVGLDDYSMGEPDYSNAFSYLNDLDEDVYTIVLTHEPDQIEEFSQYNFDLVIAGHSHLGQVRFPIVGALYTPVGAKKYYEEHYEVGDADLYISGGIGTSTMKFRFLNKPSINLYRFFTN